MWYLIDVWVSPNRLPVACLRGARLKISGTVLVIENVNGRRVAIGCSGWLDVRLRNSTAVANEAPYRGNEQYEKRNQAYLNQNVKPLRRMNVRVKKECWEKAGDKNCEFRNDIAETCP